ncbi:MAG: hypothetical protein QOJ58_1047, partial [Alphaproteobacteria bacterium]|nr:hypothetical protein [Alphaproteobacteria bacterium]
LRIEPNDLAGARLEIGLKQAVSSR